MTVARLLDVSSNNLTGKVPRLFSSLWNNGLDLLNNCLELYCFSRQSSCPCTPGATAPSEVAGLLALYRATNGTSGTTGAHDPVGVCAAVESARLKKWMGLWRVLPSV